MLLLIILFKWPQGSIAETLFCIVAHPMKCPSFPMSNYNTKFLLFVHFLILIQCFFMCLIFLYGNLILLIFIYSPVCCFFSAWEMSEMFIQYYQIIHSIYSSDKLTEFHCIFVLFYIWFFTHCYWRYAWLQCFYFLVVVGNYRIANLARCCGWNFLR